MNDIAARFWQHVAIAGEDDCWLWQRGKTGDGYGAYYEPLHPRPIYAHRYAYWLETGVRLSSQQHLLHSCDNHACCNPAHLFVAGKGEVKSNGGWKSGAKHHNAKLTDAKVKKIRRLYAAREGNQRELARMFKVSVAAINDIVNRKTWTHI